MFVPGISSVSAPVVKSISDSYRFTVSLNVAYNRSCFLYTLTAFADFVLSVAMLWIS